MQPKPHFAHLDLLKGIAIFLVVCGHIFVYGSNHLGGHDDFVLWRVLEGVHMPLFVMLSGYLALSTRHELRALPSFLRSKAKRLLVPLLFIPPLYLLCFDESFKLAISQTKKEGYWFTFVLFGIMLAFFLFGWVNSWLNKRRKISVELTLGAVSILIIVLIDGVLHAVKDSFYERLLSFDQLNWLYKYFLLGYFVRRIPRLEALLRSDHIVAALTLSFIGLMLLPYQGITFPESWSCYHGLIGLNLEALQTLTGVLTLYALGLRACDLGIDNRGTRLLNYLGRESLPIYLTHYFFLPVLPMMMPFLLGLPNSAAAFSWELLFAFVGSTWVLLLTLGTIRVVKLSPTLAMLLYGEPLKRHTNKQR